MPHWKIIQVGIELTRISILNEFDASDGLVQKCV